MKIEGIQIEKLISQAIGMGVSFRSITYVTDTIVSLIVTEGELGILRNAAGSRYRISLEGEGGIRPAAAKLLREKLLLCGIAVFVIFFAVQNLFIREVRIYGCRTVDENAVRRCAKEAGLYKGCLKGFDADKVRLSIYESFDNVVWVKVGYLGAYGEVRIVEAQAEESFSESKMKAGKKACSIVASADCYVERVRTFKGISMVEAGDYVKKGEVLISGRIPVEMSTYDEDADKIKTLRVHAAGEVIGRVPYYYSFYLRKGDKKAQAEARVREWIKENVPKEAQILNKSLNFQQKENIIKVYGIVETRMQVGVEKEKLFENSSNR